MLMGARTTTVQLYHTRIDLVQVLRKMGLMDEVWGARSFGATDETPGICRPRYKWRLWREAEGEGG